MRHSGRTPGTTKCWWRGAAVVVFLGLFAQGHAAASCDHSKRVSHRDSDCLEAWWDNDCDHGSCYRVRSHCADLGKVVAKIDVRAAMDRTLHLTDGKLRSGWLTGEYTGIHWISCCSDLSDLCNRSERAGDTSG